MKKRIIGIAIGLAVMMATPAYADQWKQDANGWWLEMSDGSYAKSGMYNVAGTSYVFGTDGYMYTNRWAKLTGEKWVYCTDSGAVAKNQWVGNYYVGADGVMLTDDWTPDGYEVGPDGAKTGKYNPAATAVPLPGNYMWTDGIDTKVFTLSSIQGNTMVFDGKVLTRKGTANAYGNGNADFAYSVAPEDSTHLIYGVFNARTIQLIKAYHCVRIN